MDTCLVAGCDKYPFTKGFCRAHYYHQRKEQFRDKSKPRNWRKDDGAPQRTGKAAELNVRSLLLATGRTVKLMGYFDSFDMLVDGKYRCEIKASKPSFKNGGAIWTFNFHRHGVLKEETTDVYILRFEDVPGHKYAVHLLLRAPQQVKVRAFTLRSLIETAAPMIQEYKAFARGQWAK